MKEEQLQKIKKEAGFLKNKDGSIYFINYNIYLGKR